MAKFVFCVVVSLCMSVNLVFCQFAAICQSPAGVSGSCISIYECPKYLDLLKSSKSNPESVKELKKAHCGFDGSTPKVCCPNTSAGKEGDFVQTTEGEGAFVPEPLPKTVKALPEAPECGLLGGALSRVVGGVPVKLGELPWMALLGYRGRTSQVRWLCGGSLITSQHVLTAAHCIHNHEDDLFQVRLGELDLSRDDDGATPIDVPIRRQIKHEGYSPRTFKNDIALLELDNEVEFTSLIQPICLPKEKELRARSFEKYMPIIAGWGDIKFRGPASPTLQMTQLPVWTKSTCQTAYEPYKAQITIDESVLCAGFPKGGKDACQGDSGGPLMQPIQKNRKTRMYQIGVVSFGKKCAEPNFPGVYTRVTEFMPWIEQNILT